MKPFFFALIMAVVLSSCDTGTIYEKSVNVNNRYWLADSLYKFEFVVEEDSGLYDVFFTLRNTSQYPFRNLYAVYTLLDSTGQSLTGELVEFELFHPKTGKPYGGGLGSIYSHKLPLVSGVEFPYPGKYLMRVEQNMRLDSLQGIVSVGITVERAQGPEEE